MSNNQILVASSFRDENNVPVSELEFIQRIEKSVSRVIELQRSLSGLQSKIEGAYTKAESLMDEKSEVNINQIRVVKKCHITNDEATISNIRNYLTESNKALLGVADAQRDAEKVIANILRYQQELADEMKYLFAIGVVNLHQCRFVSKSITLRLHRAADNEIDAAEKECLINVLEGLRKQEEYFKTISGLSDDISENRERMDNAVNQIEIIDSINKQHDERLNEKDEEDKRHNERLKDKDDKDNEHDKRLDEKDKKDEKHDERLDKHEKQLEDLAGCVKKIESESNGYDKRLKEREDEDKQYQEQLKDLADRVKKIESESNGYDKRLKEREEDEDKQYQKQLKDLADRVEKIESTTVPLWMKITVIISFVLSVISIFLSLTRF